MARSRRPAVQRHIAMSQAGSTSSTSGCSNNADLAQATLTTVQEAGLLVLVLNHLESLEDILSCSAVSKRWHCACQHIQPASLTLPGRSSRLDEDGMMSVQRWMQNKQKQGALQIKAADLRQQYSTGALATP